MTIAKKVVRLSALCTGRLNPPPPQDILLVLISVRGWVDAKGHCAAGKIISIKNSNDAIGNRSPDLLVCSAVPQLPRHHVPHLCRVFTIMYLKQTAFLGCVLLKQLCGTCDVIPRVELVLSAVCVQCLTLILLTWRIWWAPNNASRWQMGFNLAFKGLIWLCPVVPWSRVCRLCCWGFSKWFWDGSTRSYYCWYHFCF